MAVEIDISKSPPPVSGPFTTLLQIMAFGALCGALVCMLIALPIMIFTWLLMILATEFSVPLDDAVTRLLETQSSVLEEPYAPGAIFLFTTAAIATLVLASNIRLRFRRTPHFGVRMGALCAALRRFRRGLPGNSRRGRIWGWLNIGAGVCLVIAAALVDPGGRFLPLIGAVGLLINGFRLMARRSSAARYFASLVLRTPLLFAAILPLAIVGGAGALYAFSGSQWTLYFAFASVTAVYFSRRWWEPWLRAHGLALAQPLAKDALWSDRRRPVLFLRSFKDDALLIDKPMPEGVEERANNLVAEQRMENALTQVARDYGPVIAVGEPSKLQQTGAARAYYQGDDWREAVQTWMDQSLYILMIAGFTEGLSWELETAIARGHAHKIVLIFPRNHFAARWAWVKDRFPHDIAAQMRELDGAGAVAIYLNSKRQLVLLRSDKARPNYQAALTLALYGMFQDMIEGRRTSETCVDGRSDARRIFDEV